MAGSSEKWADYAKRHMKAELKRADRLTKMGIPESETSVAAKLNRGAFPAWFLFAVMRAIGLHTLHVEDWS